MTIDHKGALRRQILLVLSVTYSSAATDSVIRSALKKSLMTPGKKEFIEALKYLESKKYITLHEHEDHDMHVAAITAEGVDVVEGSVLDVGVEPPPDSLADLAITKDIRRGILSIAAQYGGWIKDRDFKTELAYTNVLTETVRYHLWYLGEKNYLHISKLELGASITILAKITGAGTDVAEKRAKDAGITE